MYLLIMCGGQAREKRSRMMRIKVLSIVLLMTCFWSCRTNDNVELTRRGDVVLPYIESVTTSFFDYVNLNHAKVEFIVNSPVKSSLVDVQVSYKDELNRKFIMSMDDFPSLVSIDFTDVLEELNLNKEEVHVGDDFVIELVVRKDGQAYRSNSVMKASVVCPSHLAGTYQCTVNGTSADVELPADISNPLVGYKSTVTIKEGANYGEYILSDFSGGAFTYWYSAYGASGDYPCTLKDVCGEMSYVDCHTTYNDPVSASGNYDPDSGIITLHVVDEGFGDTWDLILTPDE